MSNAVVQIILDKANELSLVNSWILWFYFLWYFAKRYNERALRGNADMMLISKDVGKHALALAFSLWIRETGSLVTRTFISLWHSGTGGHGGPATLFQAIGLTIGALILIGGSLLILGVLSHPLYGNRLWRAAALVSVGYVVVSSLI
jgi:hypothetical protein